MTRRLLSRDLGADLPDVLEISPASGPLCGRVRPPGSKSFSNRALPIAGLAEGVSVLTGILDSEDTRVMVDSLRQLGRDVDADWANRVVTVNGKGTWFPDAAELYLANSGTSIRFLTAICALGHGVYLLDGIERMRQRPIEDLLWSLRRLGCDAISLAANDCPPVLITAKGLVGGDVHVRGDVSSQFLSGLLMVAPMASGPLTIHVEGQLVSKPYVDMTLATMADFGVTGQREGYVQFSFPGRQRYKATPYSVEPDASGASYFLGAAAITGGAVTIDGLGSKSLQGDLGFVRVLEKMGCRVEMATGTTTVHGGELVGVDVDLCHLSDTVPTLAAVACFAKGSTTIRNVANVRVKETDRLAALTAELRKVGVGVDEFPDGMTIHPAELNAAQLCTYNDHRMAMSLALLGLRRPGIAIENPACVGKTYPNFFSDLAGLIFAN